MFSLEVRGTVVRESELLETILEYACQYWGAANRVLHDGIALHISDRFTAIALHDASQCRSIPVSDSVVETGNTLMKLRSRQVPDVFCDDWRKLVARFPVNDSTMLGAAMLAFADLDSAQQAEYALRAAQLIASGQDKGKSK